MNDIVDVFAFFKGLVQTVSEACTELCTTSQYACVKSTCKSTLIIFTKVDLLTFAGSWGICLNQMQRGVFGASLHVKIRVISAAQICIWGFFSFNLLFVSYPRRVGPVACRDGTELPFCSSAFILHLFNPPACPVLFCSAPGLFPFHWSRPSFPPLLSLLQHSSGLSPLLVKEWHGQKREEGEDAGMSNSVSWYCRNIASQLCFGFCCILGPEFCGPLVEDGRAWPQSQR